jgi:hypothetical protein
MYLMKWGTNEDSSAAVAKRGEFPHAARTLGGMWRDFEEVEVLRI